jgi:hypothetical protein
MELFITDNTRPDKIINLPDLDNGIYLADVGTSRIECLLTVYHGRATAFATGNSTDLRSWSSLSSSEAASYDWRATELRNVRQVEIDSLEVTVTKHL